MTQTHKTGVLDAKLGTVDLAAENRRMARLVLLLVVSFFTVIIGVNVTMAVLANRNWTGLVVKSAYVEGQAFNQKQAEARAQAARKWHSALSFDQGLLRFQVFDDQGQALAFEQARVQLGRPAFEQQDFELVLSQDASGALAAEQPLAPGLWALTIEALDLQGQIYKRQAQLFVRADGTGVLQ